MERTDYTVQLTPDNRFAVVTRDGLTLAEFYGEQAALTAAAALNGGPVRSINPGRWNPTAAIRHEKQAA